MALFDTEHQGGRTCGHFRRLGYTCDEVNEARLKKRYVRLVAGIITLVVLFFVPLAGAVLVTIFHGETTISPIILVPALVWFAIIALFGVIRLFNRPRCSFCGKKMKKTVVIFSSSYRAVVFVCEGCHSYCDTYVVSG